MDDREKLVNFDQYCGKCENEDKKDTDEPCDTCLAYPVNTYSHKPVNFKEKEKKLLEEHLKYEKKFYQSHLSQM